MPFNINRLKQSFTVDNSQKWNASYVHYPAKSENNENSLTHWTWWPTGKNNYFPHITTWEKDFRSNRLGSYLKSFQVSFYFNALSHKLVHVHYCVDQRGKAHFRNMDLSRLTGETKHAESFVNKHRKAFDALAQSFLERCFA